MNDEHAAPDHALARRDPTPTWAIMGNTLDQAKKFCETLLSSGLLPTAVNSPQKALVILLKGRELGLDPMVALAELHVVNGKPGISSAMMMALALKRGIRFRWLTEPDREREEAVVEIVRPNGDKHIERFTIEEAQRAGLAGRDTWKNWTANMLRSRAISRGIRYFAPDILMAYTTDELEDIQPGIAVDDVSGLDTRRQAFLDDLDARRVTREQQEAEHKAAKRQRKAKPVPVEAEVVEDEPPPAEDDDLGFMDAPAPAPTEPPKPKPAKKPEPWDEEPPAPPPPPKDKRAAMDAAVETMAKEAGYWAESDLHVHGPLVDVLRVQPGLYNLRAFDEKKLTIIGKWLRSQIGGRR